MGRLIIPDDGSGGSPVIINLEPPTPYLWTVNNPTNQGFSQIRVSDGVTTLQVQPGLEYSNNEASLLNDGLGNIWAARRLAGTDSLIKLDATTGARLGGMNKGDSYDNVTYQIAFDGTNYWYITTAAPHLRCIDINLNPVRQVTLASPPDSVLYDGVGNLWLIRSTSLDKIRASDGASLGSVTPDFDYWNGGSLVSDKTNIWVAKTVYNGGGAGRYYLLRKIRISDFAVTTYGPYGSVNGVTLNWGPMCHDGTYLYLTMNRLEYTTDCQLDKIRMSDGVRVASYDLPTGYGYGSAGGASFDGTNLWVHAAGWFTRFLKMTTDGAILGSFPSGGELGQTPGPAFTHIVMPKDWPAEPEQYVWTANTTSTGGLTQIKVSDGSYVTRVQTGVKFRFALHDGTYVWGVSEGDNTPYVIVKLDAITGAQVGYYSKDRTYNDGMLMAFDGTNYWYSVDGSPNVKCVDSNFNYIRGVSAGGTFPPPSDVIYDGVGNIWALNAYVVYKFRASDGASLGSYNTSGAYRRSMWTDKTYVWLVKEQAGSTTLIRIRISDLDVTTYTGFVGTQPKGGFYDGANVWFITNNSGTQLYKVRASDGVQQGSWFIHSDVANCVRYDGTFMWLPGINAKIRKLTTTEPPVSLGDFPTTGEVSTPYDCAFTKHVLPWP